MSDLEIRRVVTGHDAEGRAVCVEDANAPRLIQSPRRPGVAGVDLWKTERSPAPLADPDRTLEGPISLPPPAGGTVFRIVEFQPEDARSQAGVDPAQAFSHLGAQQNLVENARHPLMHRTDTIDYAVVLCGEITLLLDEEDVALHAGDVVVQRGTNHAWSNRGDEPCRVAFVLVDGTAG